MLDEHGLCVVAVNVRDAGEGTLEISICGPSGQNISNSVTTLGPGHFLVSYIPLEPGPHRANITFNGESVCGNVDRSLTLRVDRAFSVSRVHSCVCVCVCVCVRACVCVCVCVCVCHLAFQFATVA